MDLSEENVDAEYWKEQLKLKSEWRDEFFKQFRELLPPNRLKALEKTENTPKKVAERQNKGALEGHQGLRLLLPKESR